MTLLQANADAAPSPLRKRTPEGGLITVIGINSSSSGQIYAEGR